MRPLSTKDKMKTGIFRSFKQISRMWSREEIYKAKKWERTELWLIPTSILKNKEKKTVPEILCLPTDEIVWKEFYNFRIKTHFSKNEG